MAENEREIFEIRRGFVVKIQGGHQEGDLHHAVVEAIDVNGSDAFLAAAAILEPLLKHRPEIACRTIGSLVSLADHRTCEDCDGELNRAFLPLRWSMDEKYDEQFLRVSPPVMLWDHARVKIALAMLQREYERIKRMWVPQVIVKEQEGDREILVATARVSKGAVRCAQSPTKILTSIAGDVVFGLQKAIGAYQAQFFSRLDSIENLKESWQSWPWEGD